MKKNKTFKDSFKYRVGDKVRGPHGAEYEILAVDSKPYNEHYRLKNLTSLDSPFWINRFALFSTYEPCNPAIKILFEKEQDTVTLTMDYMRDAIRYAVGSHIVRKPAFYVNSNELKALEKLIK
jgi:hypothetical protein